MSAREVVGGVAYRLSAVREGRRWVRHPDSCRTLGTVTALGSGHWNWRVSPNAFRGDGRQGCERDGDPTDRVPSELLGTGEVKGPRNTACTALVAWLIGHEAPVMGFGPHPGVSAREVVRS